jgi:hypothetical protein
MAIGTTAAILGSAAIGAGASILGGSKNSKAISQASDAQAAATREATQLQREVYNQNLQIQQPFLNTGMQAMGQINALLGLGGSAGQSGAPAPATPATGIPATGGIAPDAPGQFPGTQHPFIRAIMNSMRDNGAQFPDNVMQDLDRLNAYQSGQPHPTYNQPVQTTTAPGQTSQQAANAAYDQFKNYTGYQTRLNEGNSSINSGYAAAGTLQSGAALKDLARFNQDYASNEFGNYMGYLGGQQQLGPGAANALAGVGTNYANAAGNLAMQNGNNLANSAIARANNTNSMIGGIGSSFGTALGYLARPSSFGG